MLFARSKPPTPPSISEATKDHTEVYNVRDELKKLVRNKNYCALIVVFASLNCICTCMASVVSTMTEPYDYTARQNAYLGETFIVSGVVGSIVISILLDRYHKYKLSLILLGFLSVLSITAGCFSLPSKNVGLFVANVAFIGFSGIPIAPLGNALAVELTYPVPEAISNGMLNVPNIIWGFLMGLLSSYLCEYSPIYTLILFVINSIIGCLALFCIKEDLRRLRPSKVKWEEVIVIPHQNLQSTITKEGTFIKVRHSIGEKSVASQ